MKNIILGLMLLSSFSTMAQIGLANGQNFKFKNGVTEWSEPLTVNLNAHKGDQSIPTSIRVKYNKKAVFACHYLIEITNLSETQSVKFSVGTGYTDYKGKDVVEKFSLKPKVVKEGKLVYAKGTKKPNGADDCITNWTPKLKFFETKIK